jgi:hypothetical protein
MLSSTLCSLPFLWPSRGVLGIEINLGWNIDQEGLLQRASNYLEGQSGHEETDNTSGRSANLDISSSASAGGGGARFSWAASLTGRVGAYAIISPNSSIDSWFLGLSRISRRVWNHTGGSRVGSGIRVGTRVRARAGRTGGLGAAWHRTGEELGVDTIGDALAELLGIGGSAGSLWALGGALGG